MIDEAENPPENASVLLNEEDICIVSLGVHGELSLIAYDTEKLLVGLNWPVGGTGHDTGGSSHKYQLLSHKIQSKPLPFASSSFSSRIASPA